jgi:hypothetical protein
VRRPSDRAVAADKRSPVGNASRSASARRILNEHSQQSAIGSCGSRPESLMRSFKHPLTTRRSLHLAWLSRVRLPGPYSAWSSRGWANLPQVRRLRRSRTMCGTPPSLARWQRSSVRLSRGLSSVEYPCGARSLSRSLPPSPAGVSRSSSAFPCSCWCYRRLASRPVLRISEGGILTRSRRTPAREDSMPSECRHRRSRGGGLPHVVIHHASPRSGLATRRCPRWADRGGYPRRCRHRDGEGGDGCNDSGRDQTRLCELVSRSSVRSSPACQSSL